MDTIFARRARTQGFWNSLELEKNGRGLLL
jgi:hypothetical protein